MPTASHRKFKHPSLVAAAAAAMNCLIERKIDVWPAYFLALVMVPHETASAAQLGKP